MLQVLQYLTGSSMAAVEEVADLTLVQSVVGGPKARGSSSFSGGGSACRFRGSIYPFLVCIQSLEKIWITHSSISDRGTNE